MKKILIIGAGFLQSFLIKKAKEMGYYTIAIDKNPNSIGFKYADEYSAVDIVDQDACLEYALSMEIDGVLTAATDYGVLSAAYIAENMNLPGLDYEVAKIIKNKYMVRLNFFENNIDDVSQYFEINNLEQLEDIKSQIRLPVMVKPCDGSGSKAAKRIDLVSELKDACTDAMKASLVGKALIEDFIIGKEYGVESFVYNDEIHVLGVMGKYMTSPPDYAELGHCMPSNLQIEEKIKGVVRNAIKSLGINFGSVNMDVLVTKDNRVCIVDIGARMGGNLIGSHIIPLGTGLDYMGILIRAAVGDLVDINVQTHQQKIATRILALKPGRVTGLPDFKDIEKQSNVRVYHNLKVGAEIRKYHTNLDGCGYVVAVSSNTRDAESNAEMAKKMIDLGIVRE